jgi:hypothetical protein
VLIGLLDGYEGKVAVLGKDLRERDARPSDIRACASAPT